MNATAEQIERANKAVSNGCKLPFEKILEMEIKKDAKQMPRQMSKKDIAKREQRNNVEANKDSMTMTQIQDFNELQIKNQKRVIR